MNIPTRARNSSASSRARGSTTGTTTTLRRITGRICPPPRSSPSSKNPHTVWKCRSSAPVLVFSHLNSPHLHSIVLHSCSWNGSKHSFTNSRFPPCPHPHRHRPYVIAHPSFNPCFASITPWSASCIVAASFARARASWRSYARWSTAGSEPSFSSPSLSGFRFRFPCELAIVAAFIASSRHWFPARRRASSFSFAARIAACVLSSLSRASARASAALHFSVNSSRWMSLSLCVDTALTTTSLPPMLSVCSKFTYPSN